jgi:hypothetical protein
VSFGGNLNEALSDPFGLHISGLDSNYGVFDGRFGCESHAWGHYNIQSEFRGKRENLGGLLFRHKATVLMKENEGRDEDFDLKANSSN